MQIYILEVSLKAQVMLQAIPFFVKLLGIKGLTLLPFVFPGIRIQISKITVEL